MSTTTARTSDDAHDGQADLRAAWTALLTPHAHRPSSHVAATGRELISSWADPARRYHDLDHLRDVLAGVGDLAAHATDVDAVALAAWYHDAVYRGRPDDEAASAIRATAELSALGMHPRLVTEVARMVRLTATHDTVPGDANGDVLCDADLAVLAASPDRYVRYTAAVRAEYAHVPDDQFRTGRAQLLCALLDGPSLFRTPAGCQWWETAARVNLETELRTLTGH